MTAVPKPTFKKREYKRPAIKELVPLEETEQATVIEWLKLHNVLFSANVPDRRYCKRMGYSPGLPDLVIFQKPPAYNGQFVGCAIELKRRKGGIVSPEQRIWIEKLQKEGWIAVVCAGADEAILILEQCGYSSRKEAK